MRSCNRHRITPTLTQKTRDFLKMKFGIDNLTVNQEEAVDIASEPFKEFMLKQVRSKDLALFLNIADVEEVKSNEDGTVNVEDLKTLLSPEIAGIMLTNPNTLGIFEKAA